MQAQWQEVTSAAPSFPAQAGLQQEHPRHRVLRPAHDPNLAAGVTAVSQLGFNAQVSIRVLELSRRAWGWGGCIRRLRR